MVYHDRGGDIPTTGLGSGYDQMCGEVWVGDIEERWDEEATGI